jgi:hypothetical protein
MKNTVTVSFSDNGFKTIDVKFNIKAVSEYAALNKVKRWLSDSCAFTKTYTVSHASASSTVVDSSLPVVSISNGTVARLKGEVTLVVYPSYTQLCD